jgi:hypothetical protein
MNVRKPFKGRKPLNSGDNMPATVKRRTINISVELDNRITEIAHKFKLGNFTESVVSLITMGLNELEGVATQFEEKDGKHRKK